MLALVVCPQALACCLLRARVGSWRSQCWLNHWGCLRCLQGGLLRMRLVCTFYNSAVRVILPVVLGIETWGLLRVRPVKFAKLNWTEVGDTLLPITIVTAADN